MGIADRRERDKRQRRCSIVDAAEKLFFAKGFAATTIDEIAEAAELSKGTIYLYFKNKEEIYAAIVRRGMRILTDLSDAAVAAAPTGAQKIRALGQALLTFYERHPRHFRALFYHHESPACPLPGRDPGDPLIEALVSDRDKLYAFGVEAIRGGIADGSIRPDADPVKATIILVGMILGLIRMVAVEEEFLHQRFNLNGDDLIKAAFEMLGRPLAIRPPWEAAKGP